MLTQFVPSKIKTVVLVDDSSSVSIQIPVIPKTSPDNTQMYDRLWPIAGNVSILVRDHHKLTSIGPRRRC